MDAMTEVELEPLRSGAEERPRGRDETGDPLRDRPKALDTRATAQTFRNLRLMHLLERIALKFDGAGIPLMALKGAALNLTLYGRPDARPMDDLDLAIRPEHIGEARRLLEELGGLRGEVQVREDFFPRYHYETEYGFGTVYPVKVDLHVRPFRPLRYAQTVPPDAFWDDAMPLRMGDATLLHPSPDAMLIHLAVHAAVHRCAQRKWVEDIHQWIRVYGDQIDWDEFLAKVERWRLALPAREALTKAEATRGPVCPPHVLRALARSRVSWRDRLVLRQAPRDAAHPAAHVLVNALCTPGLWFILGYLRAVAIPEKAHMADWYCRRHFGWLPTAHLLRWLGPIAKHLPRLWVWPSKIETQKSQIHGIGVFAAHDIRCGEVVAHCHGKKAERRGMYTVPVSSRSGAKQYRELTGKLRFLNHSCNPNAELSEGKLIALRSIPGGQEITIDYGQGECKFRAR